jgi:hypothetical protein
MSRNANYRCRELLRARAMEKAGVRSKSRLPVAR